MKYMLKPLAIAILSLAAVIAGPMPAAFAAPHDGNWSVLVITEKGDCDAAYRYGVTVSTGRVSYRGEASINLSGTIAPTGAVEVTIKRGGQGANANGRLSGNAGAGTWHGASSTGACSGRWEAERR